MKKKLARKKHPLLAVIAVVTAIAIVLPLFAEVADAKTTPSSRPDIEINVQMIGEEIGFEEGNETKWDYVTEHAFDGVGRDLGKLQTVFELVAVPVVKDFFERHESTLAGNYVDTLFVRYRPHNNEILVSIWYSPSVYETMPVNALPEQHRIEFVDEVSFKVSILKQFPELNGNYQSWVDFNVLEYNLLPAASARVAYLSDRMQELYLESRDTLLKNDTSLALPEKEPIILKGISAVMFEEMARLSIGYMDRPAGLYDGGIIEYDSGATRLASLRLPTSDLKPNEPVLYIKSANQTLKIYVTVHYVEEVENAWLEYPYGRQISIHPVNSVVEEYVDGGLVKSLKTIDYEQSLGKDEPAGIYKILVQVPEGDAARAWITTRSGSGDTQDIRYSEQEPTQEQLQECKAHGIEEEKCSEDAILRKNSFRIAANIDETEKQRNSIASSFALIGIGVAGAAAAAIITLKKLR